MTYNDDDENTIKPLSLQAKAFKSNSKKNRIEGPKVVHTSPDKDIDFSATELLQPPRTNIFEMYAGDEAPIEFYD